MWLLIALVLVLAVAGGFLGTLLEIAAWVVVLAAVVLAGLALLGYRYVSSRGASRSARV